jgi:CheY-like chemotaxis protein
MKKRILICDDDEDILEVSKIILKNHYDIETLTHCNDIFNHVIHIKPDLIFMDLWIPDMGGEAVTQLLKSSERTSSIPLIIFSANNDIEKVAEGVGANGFLRKPFDIDNLINKIKEYLV